MKVCNPDQVDRALAAVERWKAVPHIPLSLYQKWVMAMAEEIRDLRQFHEWAEPQITDMNRAPPWRKDRKVNAMKKTPRLIVVCAECETCNPADADLCAECNNPLNGPLLNAAAAAVAGQAYVELLMAVERKFPGESRHQTALRYIREAEARASAPANEAEPLQNAKPKRGFLGSTPDGGIDDSP